MESSNPEARTKSIGYVNAYNLKRNNRMIAHSDAHREVDLSFLSIRDARRHIMEVRQVAKEICDDIQSGKSSLEEVKSNFRVKRYFQLLNLADGSQSATSADLKRKQSKILRQRELLSAFIQLCHEKLASQIETEFEKVKEEFPDVLKTVKLQRLEDFNKESQDRWIQECFG